MSYILDALRKVDQERSIGDVPDLETPHWSKRRGGLFRHWVWLLIGLLIINGAFFAVLFNRDDGGESRPAVTANVPDLVQDQPRNIPQTMPLEPSQEQQLTTVMPPQRADRLPLKPLARPERNIIPRPRQVVPPVVKRPPTSTPAVTAAPRTAVTGSPVVQPAAPEPAGTGVSEIPEWHELSLEFKSGYNPPRLDVHVYDDEPTRRFILINLQRYVEGDTLGDGAKLEKIMPGSIQLYYEGTRFRVDR